jgi:phosphatidylglycerol---prolipoprotein diacylglyceryl transferase
MSIDQFGIHIGPYLYIRFYGVILMTGAVAAAWLISRESRRRGQNPDVVWDGLIWVLIGGILGARLWHILTPPPSFVERGITVYFYLTHPLDAIAIWNGGLGIAGAVAGGALALYLFCRRYKLSFATWADMAVPGVALGQAIGRWANYVNQELYGARTDLPWKLYVPHEDGYFHPLFFYESMWNLGNMFFLLWLSHRYADRLKPGDIVLIYLITYPVARFFLEFLRIDAPQTFGLNINQALMAVVIVVSAFVLWCRHRQDKKVTSV